MRLSARRACFFLVFATGSGGAWSENLYNVEPSLVLKAAEKEIRTHFPNHEVGEIRRLTKETWLVLNCGPVPGCKTFGVTDHECSFHIDFADTRTRTVELVQNQGGCFEQESMSSFTVHVHADGTTHLESEIPGKSLTGLNEVDCEVTNRAEDA